MGTGALQGLIDIPRLQALMDSFYRASSIPVGILDTEGNILVATGWQDICTKYHRIHPDTSAKCRVSDDYIKANLRVGEYIEYKCQNNMWDLATPIVIKGRHVATLFLGQFFYDDETVDVEFFRRQAGKYGFPAEGYLDALAKVPVFSRQKVKDIMGYYTQFVQMLIGLGLARLEVENVQANLQKLADERAKKVLEATATLRESEEKYRQIFHGSMAIKLLIDPETGQLADANEAACRFYGYTKDELLSQKIYDINTLTPAEINAEMEAAKTQKRNHFNFRHRLASGEVRDVEVYSSPVQAGGKFLHSIIHDVTERRKSERLLRCRAELSALFATASMDDLIQSGLDAAEHLTSSCIAYFHFVDDDQENLTLQTWSTNTLKNMCKAEGKGQHYPISKAGVWVDCFHQKKPVIHNDYAALPHRKGLPEGHAPVIRELGIPVMQGNKVMAIMGMGNKETDYTQDDVEVTQEAASILFDLIERKRAEEALRLREKLLKEGQAISHVGNWDWDIATGVNTWSDEQCRIFGYEPGTINPDHDLFINALHGDDRPVVRAALEDALSGRAPYNIDCRIVLRDGTVKYINCKGEVERDAAGKPKRMAGTVQDVTERILMENGLREAKKAAEEATLVKDKFVSLVAHDLKSPLTSMTGFLKLVRDDEAKPLDEGAKAILDRAIDSSRQLARLIDDLLNINRLKAGQLKLDKQFFDAKYLGAKMCVDFAYPAENKGIRLINRIPDNSRIYGDKTLLGEALQNLVTNAIKFCRKGDTITVSLSETGKTAIQVKDTGPGMKPEMLDRLFKYETKTSTVGTAGETGSGFGLPLAKDIMLLHGGDLEAASELDKGSVFTLKVPYVRPRILIVDDDPAFRYLLVQILLKADADITEAEDGVAAADMTAEGEELPHLIILDIEMPRMTGLELLSHLQKRHETQSIPVIVISGQHGMEIRDTVYNLGGKDFLTKQLDIDDFIPRVRRFIG